MLMEEDQNEEEHNATRTARRRDHAALCDERLLGRAGRPGERWVVHPVVLRMLQRGHEPVQDHHDVSL